MFFNLGVILIILIHIEIIIYRLLLLKLNAQDNDIRYP